MASWQNTDNSVVRDRRYRNGLDEKRVIWFSRLRRSAYENYQDSQSRLLSYFQNSLLVSFPNSTNAH